MSFRAYRQWKQQWKYFRSFILNFNRVTGKTHLQRCQNGKKVQWTSSNCYSLMAGFRYTACRATDWVIAVSRKHTHGATMQRNGTNKDDPNWANRLGGRGHRNHCHKGCVSLYLQIWIWSRKRKRNKEKKQRKKEQRWFVPIHQNLLGYWVLSKHCAGTSFRENTGDGPGLARITSPDRIRSWVGSEQVHFGPCWAVGWPKIGPELAQSAKKEGPNKISGHIPGTSR